MDTQQAFKSDLRAALQGNASAAALDAIVPQHFPTLSAFREENDLILVEGETRRLLIRRVGPDRFVTSDHAAASGSTNILDAGGENECDLDGLGDRIAAFAAV
jgi:adenylosuccinate synthase